MTALLLLSLGLAQARPLQLRAMDPEGLLEGHVQARLIAEGEAPQSLALPDDGKEPDAMPGDGVRTGVGQLPAASQFTLELVDGTGAAWRGQFKTPEASPASLDLRVAEGGRLEETAAAAPSIASPWQRWEGPKGGGSGGLGWVVAGAGWGLLLALGVLRGLGFLPGRRDP